MLKKNIKLLFLMVIIFVMGCSKSNERIEDPVTTDGDSDSDTDVDSDVDSDTSTGCEEIDFPVAVAPPNMLILLDRSGSMLFGTPSPWDNVIPAIEKVTELMDSRIRFGLMLFPGDMSSLEEGCVLPVKDPIVPIASLNAQAIKDLFGRFDSDNDDQLRVEGGTPTTESIRLAEEYLSGLDDEGKKYILLATDGAPNCSSDTNLSCDDCTTTRPDGVTCYSYDDCLDDVLAIETTSTTHLEKDIGVYVIGMGGAVDSWTKVMNEIAIAGGTEGFYSAEDSSQLEWALDHIIADALQCTFKVDWDALGADVSHSQDLVNIFVDGETAVYSPECANPMGWKWFDKNTIEMCEEFCKNYKGAVVKKVSATFGCESIVE